MSVRKREWESGGESKSAWIVDYVDGEGHRHIKTFAKQKDANEYRDTVGVNIRAGVHSNSKLTVAEAAAAWVKRVEADGAERTTIDQYRQHVELHIVPQIGRTKLSELTPQSVERLRDNLLKNLESRSMARKVLTSFKSLLKAAKHAHVAGDVSIKRSPRDKRPLEVGRDIPTPGEVKRTIAAAQDERRRALLLVAALTGLRASELRGLRWAHEVKGSHSHDPACPRRFDGLEDLEACLSQRRGRSRFSHRLRADRTPQEYAGQSAADPKGRWRGGQSRQTQICVARFPTFLRFVVHQSKGRWRSRAAGQGRAILARP